MRHKSHYNRREGCPEWNLHDACYLRALHFHKDVRFKAVAAAECQMLRTGKAEMSKANRCRRLWRQLADQMNNLSSLNKAKPSGSKQNLKGRCSDRRDVCATFQTVSKLYLGLKPLCDSIKYVIFCQILSSKSPVCQVELHTKDKTCWIVSQRSVHPFKRASRFVEMFVVRAVLSFKSPSLEARSMTR